MKFLVAVEAYNQRKTTICFVKIMAQVRKLMVPSHNVTADPE
jgi:hypothetical protein